MSSIGSFGTFTTARLAIYASQKGLSVTGNNIANINTVGYTRQRLDLTSFKTGGSDRYAAQNDKKVGNGVFCSNVSQLRDPYLDIQYRTAMSSVGFLDTKLSGLNDIEAILDEIGKGTDESKDGILFAQLSDFLSSLEQVSVDAGAKVNDTLAKASASALTQLFHTYATELEKLENNARDGFKQDVAKVNSILTSIRDLNASIRKADIHGDPALEMRDDRNLLIDELSEYMNIDVLYSEEEIGAGMKVEKLTIKLGNSNPDPAVTTDSATLVDGIYAVQFATPKENPAYNKDFDIYNKDSQAYADALAKFENAETVTVDGKVCTTQAELDQAIADHMTANPDDAIKTFKYLDENGVGTNDLMDAEQDPNENYDLFLTKLLDSKGREWTSTTSTLTKIDDPAWAAKKAVYQTQITQTSGWSDGDTISITVGGKQIDLKVKNDSSGDLLASTANDKAKLAKIIARKLNETEGVYDDYSVSSDAEGHIIFTARKAGAVGGAVEGVPATPPEALTLGGTSATQGSVTAATATPTETVKGQDQDLTKLPPDTETLNDDGSVTTVTTQLLNGEWYTVTAVTQHTFETTLDDNDLYGRLQSRRELLTEAGEFTTTDALARDENATIKRGIPYYRKSLDLLANKIATEYNKANIGYARDQDGNYLDANGKVLEDLAGEPVNAVKGLTDAQKQALIDGGCVDANGEPDLDRWLEAKGAEKMGGALFSIRGDLDDTNGITASNISVSKSWSTGDITIVPTFVKLFGGEVNNTLANQNINHMVSLVDQKLDYNPQDLVADAVSTKLFHGSFHEMFSNMGSVLGNDKRETEIMLNTYYDTSVEIDMNRDGVSGVDLNDEAMNLMQYSKSLNAAYRLMTTIDEALDRLINNTGVVGR